MGLTGKILPSEPTEEDIPSGPHGAPPLSLSWGQESEGTPRRQQVRSAQAGRATCWENLEALVLEGFENHSGLARVFPGGTLKLQTKRGPKLGARQP